ncbi:tetratricopeptide repeat protein [Winogradskyella ouciana]|uniref:Tetratricopeptide repeat protein n=1 Tax=Winogradskyella ouciana TaxID=2608631 RepID=A0A7K1GGX9_9FLAO|nr:tetratricopeptide repeat protein [Winogradskyella ouciana]MTE27668.1 tetratricopeptide repeat protein [Winogradskyella ouciana]
MILKRILPFILIVMTFSCNSNKVTESEEYKAYLSTTIDNEKLMSNAQFWTDKLKSNPDEFPYLVKRAGEYTQIFNATGNIDYLIKAEKDLIKSIEQTNGIYASQYRALASNYISQHRFKEALELLEKAKENGEKLNSTKKMLFDVHLELGNYMHAESYLEEIKNKSDFDYLIRLAKWEDHKGNLDGAIEQMEKAAAIAEASNLKDIKQWSYTNLADFYGHAGEIKKSYNHYLKALELDPNDAYAKKGIAWILYSHENNPDEALKILDHISTYYHAPDYDLLKAEIADFMNDSELKSEAINNYKEAVRNEMYGDMYNKYNVTLYAEDMLLPEEALAIAKKEVENRPTPQSYDLLAWSYFKIGDVEKANAIVEEYVEGQTYEPGVLYHIAEIYKAVGKTEKVKELKSELVASLYELGPTMAPKIKQL